MKIKEFFKQRRMLNITVTSGLILVILIVFGVACQATTDMQTKAAVSLFDVNQGTIAQGTIEGKAVNINSKVPGRVVKVYVEEGQKVKKGDPLIEISSEELQAKKTQAEAAVTQAEAALKAAKELEAQAKAGIEASNGLVSQAEAGVQASEKQYEAAKAVKNKADKGARSQDIAKAQTAYDLMKASYDRIVILEEKGAVSQQKLDEVKAQLEVAEQTLSLAKEGAQEEDKAAATATSEQALAGVSAARAQLTQAMAGVDASKALLYQAVAGVEAKEGLVAQAKGALAEVQAYLDEVVIKAPIDGIVTAFSSNEGELVSTGTPIAVVSVLTEPWVKVDVKETEIGQITEGQQVDVKVPAYPNKVFKGTVTTINAEPSFAVKRATKENGDFDIVSFGVKIKLMPTEQVLRPGMSAYIQFKASK